MTFQQAVQYGLTELQHISNYKQEIYWILEYITKKKISELLLHKNYFINQEKKFIEIIEKRKNHYPLQYLLTTVEFMGSEFIAEEGVLIPREETSTLVEYIINYSRQNTQLLEIGVGSGIISISIKKNRPDIIITATDINSQAISLSQINEKNILNKNTINYIETSLFQDINKEYDIIVSNPPYIKKEELIESDKELLYEPENALVAEDEGMYFYKKIIEQGKKHLKKNGFIILEISPLRKQQLEYYLKNDNYHFIYDLYNQERVIVIK